MASKSKRRKELPAAPMDKKPADWKKHFVRLREAFPVSPLAFILFAVPLIVYAKIAAPQLTALMVRTPETIQLDLDTYYKGIWLIMAAVLSLLILVGKRLKGDLKIRSFPMMYPLALFLFLAVLSALFSEYRPIALSGYPNRYEGVYVLLAYGAAFYAAVKLIHTEKQYRFMLASLWASSVILSIIGLLQAAGLNPFLTGTVQKLILPSALHPYIGTFTAAGGGRDVFLTMGNSNYAGGYMAMVLAVFLTLMLATRNRRVQAVLFISNGLMLLALFLSSSRAGYVALLCSLLVTVLMLRRKIVRRWKLVLVLLILFVAANAAAGIWGTRSFVQGMTSAVRSAGLRNELYPTHIKDLDIDNNRLTLTGTEESFTILMNETGEPTYLNEVNQPLAWNRHPASEDVPEIHEITTEGYVHYQVSWETHDLGKLLKLHNGYVDAEFFYQENQFYLIGRQGELLPYEPVPFIGFEGRERMGNARGYIWSRSLPLLQDTLLIGRGPDTFVYYFPRFDYLAMLQNRLRPQVIFDKPHNYYLQTAIHTGLISLLALLAFFGMYLTNSLRRYLREEPTEWVNQYGISLLAGCVAYLIAGIFNDSVIGTSAVFWVLLGMGTALLLTQETGQKLNG